MTKTEADYQAANNNETAALDYQVANGLMAADDTAALGTKKTKTEKEVATKD